MSKKKYTAKKHTKQNRKAKPKISLANRLDDFSLKYEKYILWGSLAISLIFTFLLFDLKVSRGGDDAEYIIRAMDFVHHFKYPSFQGPLYPFVLSPFIAIWGLNLGVLKIVSTLFIFLSFYFLFRAFSKKIPSFILVSSFIIFVFDAYLLYYGYQTYSEAFFMFLQALLFFIVLQKMPDNKKLVKNSIILGFVLFLIAITKNIGLIVFISVVIYFLVQKEWKKALFPSAAFISFEVIWEFLKRLLWSAKELQVSSQAHTLLLKHPYDATKGYEDLAGFAMRFFQNSGIYLSKHLFMHMGFRAEVTTISVPLTILAYILFGIALFYAFKKNKNLLFLAIYLMVILGASFIVLQTIWDSPRLMTPYYPIMLITLLSGLYYLLNERKLKSLFFIFPLIVVIIGYATIRKTFIKIDKNADNLRHTLKGDMLYGLTPDWQNFIKMSQWAAKNIPDSVKIASRKPSISYVYTGRRFAGIYKVPVLPLDSLKQKIKNRSNPYVIINTEQWEKQTQLQRYYMNIQAYNIGYITEYWTKKGEKMARESQIFEVYEIPKKAKTKFEFLKQSNAQYLTNLGDFETARANVRQKMPDWNVSYIVTDPDNLLQNLKNQNIHFVIMANLRKYEKMKTQYTINTIRRYLYYIQRKFPMNLRQVKTIGNDEQAYLFEIAY